MDNETVDLVIRRLVTRDKVAVDSVISTLWYAGKGGIKEIEPTPAGVAIIWVQGFTFVPWSNVMYVSG